MKRFSLQTSLILVRICIITAILVLIGLFLVSFKTAQIGVGDLWKQLGITEQQASEKIRNSFFYGYIDHSGAKNIKNLAAGNKAAIAKDLVLYTQTYMKSAAFKAAYNKERNASKPTPLQLKSVDKEDIRKQKIEELKTSIKKSEELIKSMPAIEKDVRKSIADMEKTIKEYQQPDNKMIRIFYESALGDQAYEKQYYEKRMKQWQSSYPEDPGKKIKERLQHYLSLAATVDFDAELITKSNRKIFVNKEYEGKGDEWKKIFRAGKEVYNAVKPVAEQWLKELQ